MSGHSPEDIAKSVKKYKLVGGILFFFTFVTVAVSYLDLAIGMALLVCLSIASIKGGFVSLIFMHLSGEKKIIYQVLALTGIFFIVMLSIPKLQTMNQAGRDVAPAAQWVYFEGHEGGHDSDHGDDAEGEHDEEHAPENPDDEHAEEAAH